MKCLFFPFISHIKCVCHPISIYALCYTVWPRILNVNVVQKKSDLLPSTFPDKFHLK